jgi:hypothetical protein
LGQKQVAKQVFESKKHKSRFSSHHNGWNLGKTGDGVVCLSMRRIVCFFFKKKGGRTD